MKSMLPKQKSYIPRFALMINTLQNFDNDKNEPLYFITKESILKAEKLSKYFISMAKKIKINSTEVNEYKETLSKNKALTKKERVIQIYKENPDFNRSEVAELIGVSRQSIQNYIKEL
jgi:transcriptional regulator with PAS, ATPase and Fis domain